MRNYTYQLNGQFEFYDWHKRKRNLLYCTKKRYYISVVCNRSYIVAMKYRLPYVYLNKFAKNGIRSKALKKRPYIIAQIISRFIS